MRDLYSFLIGPGLFISFTIFFGGLIFRLVQYVRGLDQSLDRVAYLPQLGLGARGAAQSILIWLIPFGTRSWRRNPFFTAAFFLLHFCLLILPFFIAGHTVILKNMLDLPLPALPQILTHILTLAALGSIAFLFLRRIALPEVRNISSLQDYLLLILVSLPFSTGFLAAWQLPGHDFLMLLHVTSAEAILILAPFSKLSHIVLFFASRAQIGMDFAIKRGGENRGPCFPW